MSMEKAKTTLLTILIMLSLVLTWNLWTYQPEYETIQSTEYIQDVSVGGKILQSHDLIKPSMLMFHVKNSIFGTSEEVKIDEFLSTMDTWRFYDFRNLSGTLAKRQFKPNYYSKGSIELVYPTSIPINTLKDIFYMDDGEEFHTESFDRVVIHVEGKSIEQEPIVHFVSSKNHKLYQAKVSNISLQNLKNDYYNQARNYAEYFPYLVSNSYYIYLPEKSVKMNRVTYQTQLLSPDTLKDALFSDPSFVKHSSMKFGEESYTDGARALEVFENRRAMKYINPTRQELNQFSANPLVQQSIEFVNDHHGWTDSYRLESWNLPTQKTVFRLLVDYYPVFDLSNNIELSTIEQKWQNSEIFRYSRSLVDLRFEVMRQMVTLPSGQKLIEYLQHHKPNFDPQYVSQITLGYKIANETNNVYVMSVVPVWMIQYRGKWEEVIFNASQEKGGDVFGVEQNEDNLHYYFPYS